MPMAFAAIQAAAALVATYNQSLYTSMKELNSNFTVSKSIEPFFNIAGEFITDTLITGNITVDSMKIGILDVAGTQNVLGWGYGEANSSFISLPEALVNAGTIKSPAFSIYVEKPVYSPHTRIPEDREHGIILFGGVNKSKYNGTLETLPIVENLTDHRKAFRVDMTGLSINETSVLPEAFPTQALFNPSNYYTYMPDPIANRVFSELGIIESPMFGPASIPCNLTSSGITLTFEFGAAKFNLDIGLFIETYSMYNEKTICYFCVSTKTDNTDANSVVLGASFLQQIYTVYDMGNDEISLAQRNWDSSEDEILEIVTEKHEITTEKHAVPEAMLEGDDADNTDDSKVSGDSEDKKSVGSHIGESTGLQLSLSIFVIWSFFC
ncbi:Peptidase A1 [Penicillium paradoxum]|uniref:Peptidase A1 n=1 Tax=Penicillium paradoxum TaxID=176176 RepID=UPI002548CD03|nr:Peptidase A1 [Penicillium paradoxum]KAJ5773889.1 Peptidase A1 [Penicillium paradoxum]